MFERNRVSLSLRSGQRRPRSSAQRTLRRMNRCRLRKPRKTRSPLAESEPGWSLMPIALWLFARLRCTIIVRGAAAAFVQGPDCHDPGGATGGRSLVVRFTAITWTVTQQARREGVRLRQGNLERQHPWLRRIRTGRGGKAPACSEDRECHSARGLNPQDGCPIAALGQ